MLHVESRCEGTSQGTGLARRKKVAGPSIRTIAEQTQTAFHPRHPVWQIARRRGLFRRGRSAFLFPSTLHVGRWILRRPLNGRNNLFDGETLEQKVGSSVCQRPVFRFLIEESGEHQHLCGPGERLDGADGVQTAYLAHLDVQQDHVRSGLTGQCAQHGVRRMKRASAPDTFAPPQYLHQSGAHTLTIVHEPDIDRR